MSFKIYPICTLLLLVSIITSAQNNDDKKIEYQFKQRMEFHSVDENYELIDGAVYHTNSGFRVFSGYDKITVNGEVWLVFQYPKWEGRGQARNRDELSEHQAEYIQGLTRHYELHGIDDIKLAIKETDFQKQLDTKNVESVYSLKLKNSVKVATGFMSVPFKLRPKQDSINFNMTTDITLGAYIGAKIRISKKGNNYLVVPATLGLSFINVSNNETSNVNTDSKSGLVPGWTWSSGLVFDLKGFNVGLVFGQDFASGVGDDWLYNKKIWYSFAIGYSFLGNK